MAKIGIWKLAFFIYGKILLHLLIFRQIYNRFIFSGTFSNSKVLWHRYGKKKLNKPAFVNDKKGSKSFIFSFLAISYFCLLSRFEILFCKKKSVLFHNFQSVFLCERKTAMRRNLTRAVLITDRSSRSLR